MFSTIDQFNSLSENKVGYFTLRHSRKMKKTSPQALCRSPLENHRGGILHCRPHEILKAVVVLARPCEATVERFLVGEHPPLRSQ